MTKEQAKDILFVIEEFAQGKKIKVPNQHGEWVEQLDVSFEDNYTKYRIVNEDKVNSWSIPDRMSCYNLFVYGTLALKEKQDELGLVKDEIKDGADGSPIENQAHAVAGILMRE